MNCMKKEEKKGFRPFTNELELGLGWNLEERSCDENEGFGSREKKERSKYLSKKWIGFNLKYK